MSMHQIPHTCCHMRALFNDAIAAQLADKRLGVTYTSSAAKSKGCRSWPSCTLKCNAKGASSGTISAKILNSKLRSLRLPKHGYLLDLKQKPKLEHEVVAEVRNDMTAVWPVTHFAKAFFQFQLVQLLKTAHESINKQVPTNMTQKAA